ncbi:tRNA (adenosine(37)-N6)-threonylcarbamoyltransferase complex ATPase subunit type 1 TsaE [Candidatus Uhrbacteria bacterium]|nr:tRNA (adenosine(37)-N6)-threonylcarbamoyltransferase complex ATPase subunit type 1 TsaE [Candidatus Uhrbacteria bacterium]
MKQFVSHSERDTERIAANFAKTLRGGEVILLNGDLGAGKTVFVRGLARGLGIRGRITSPTFVLMRMHRAASHKLQAASKRLQRRCPKCRQLEACSCQLIAWFVHVDAYRVRNSRDLEAIGLFEWIGRPDAVVAIEWGERVERALRRFRCVRIAMQSTTGDDRRIIIRRS